MQIDFQFLDRLPQDDVPASPVDWLLRSYDSFVEWKTRARDEYIRLNGDSHAARNRVAWVVRNYFTESKLSQEQVGRWKGNEIVYVHLTPPNITDSNATYVDWIYIADVLLIHCAAEHDDIDQENQRRDTEYQRAYNSYRLRIAVEEAQEAIQEAPGAADEVILAALLGTHLDASMATVKEARKRVKSKSTFPKAELPHRGAPIAPFVPLYFHS